MNLKKLSPATIGLLQALAVTLYCTLVSSFFRLMNDLPRTPGVFHVTLVLFLLVFSAAVCGLVVFGYPAFLMINKHTKRAVAILAYTFLFSMAIMLAILLVISV